MLNNEFTSQFSLQLDTFVNGFALEELNEVSENISRIKECENEATKQSMIIKNTDKIE